MREVFGKFLADRGTHLAAMIAYFALLSFVPLLFIAISFLGFLGQQHESSFLVEQLRTAFPESSVDDLVNAVEAIRKHAGELTLIGIVGLAWGALGFFSALESAFNIVYGVRNRGFARQKALMMLLVGAALAVLFLGLLAGSVGVDLARRAGVGDWLAYSAGIAVSSALVLAFTWGAYRLITNVRLGWRETLPGALVATVLLEASFQLVPVFVAAVGQLATLRAFGGLLAMLVWLYLMANVIVLGAEVNVVHTRRPLSVRRWCTAQARGLLSLLGRIPYAPPRWRKHASNA